jgi:hypothetical protein
MELFCTHKIHTESVTKAVFDTCLSIDPNTKLQKQGYGSCLLYSFIILYEASGEEFDGTYTRMWDAVVTHFEAMFQQWSSDVQRIQKRGQDSLPSGQYLNPAPITEVV